MVYVHLSFIANNFVLFFCFFIIHVGITDDKCSKLRAGQRGGALKFSKSVSILHKPEGKYMF
jgi:hypothetical protein